MTLLVVFAFVFVLSGCLMHHMEDYDSPFAQNVGRHAEFRTTVIVYDYGAEGRLGIPAGEWPASKEEKVKATLEPHTSFDVKTPPGSDPPRNPVSYPLHDHL